jgi:competence protein ComFC
MFFSRHCAACGSPGEKVLCRRCRFSMASAGSARNASDIRAAFSFEGLPRDLVLALKFRHRRAAAAVLADHMVRRLRLARVDVVTWAPTTSRRARRRGYDQAEAIAQAIARQLGVPCRRLLYRAHGTAQTGKSRADRLVGPAFRARKPRSGLVVLVVDDVVTTGATLRAAANALRSAGVAHVQLVAAASAEFGQARRAVPRSASPPPVGCAPAWASSIASSELVKARS